MNDVSEKYMNTNTSHALCVKIYSQSYTTAWSWLWWYSFMKLSILDESTYIKYELYLHLWKAQYLQCKPFTCYSDISLIKVKVTPFTLSKLHEQGFLKYMLFCTCNSINNNIIFIIWYNLTIAKESVLLSK